MKKGGFVKDALILCLITLVAGALLGGFYEITKEPIKISEENALKVAYENVLPGGKTFEDVSEEIVGASAGYPASMVFTLRVKDENSKIIGYIVETVTKGYGGDVYVLVGFDTNKKITGIAYPKGLQETPGLGMKVANEKFYKQFAGKDTNNTLIIDKSGTSTDPGRVDAVSGATKSSKAVVDCVNTACGFASRAMQNDNL